MSEQPHAGVHVSTERMPQQVLHSSLIAEFHQHAVEFWLTNKLMDKLQ